MLEAEFRKQICLIGQLMHRNGFVDGASGNISVRINDQYILTTPSGIAKGFMTPDHLIAVDLYGTRVDSPTSSNQQFHPTSELALHLACYRERPDVHGVVHAHPPTAVALTISGHSFTEYAIPEMVMLLGVVLTLPYASPTSDEIRETIAHTIQEHDVLMLSYHGSLTVAKNVWDAYLRLETLEHSAKIIYMVSQLGGAQNCLKPTHIEHLISIRERLGLLRPHEREQLIQLFAS